jgi:hypothetical protein
MPRPRLLIVVLLAGLAAVGCGRTEPIGEEPDQPALLTPQRQSFENLGFPEFATKNTTRVAGTNATRTAAAVVRAVFPDRARKPAAITLVDTSDWRVAVAAAALMAAPIKAPVLYSDGNDLPAASRRAIDVLEPAGSKAAGNAQIIRVGDVAKPSGYESTDLRGSTPLALTRSIAGLIISAKTRTAPSVIVTSADDPSYAAPAAGYAAKTGDPILFVNKNKIPPETRAALATLSKPRIYLLGPSKVISPKVSRELRRLGAVKRVGGQDPVRNAIEFARYFDGDFGWAVSTPGHGMVFARAGRPLDAAAAAPLSGAGSYGCKDSCSTRSRRIGPTRSRASTTTAGSSATARRSRSRRRPGSTACSRSGRSARPTTRPTNPLRPTAPRQTNPHDRSRRVVRNRRRP